MKKLVLFLTCILTSVFVTGQTTKGTILLGMHNYTPSGFNYDGLPFYIPQSNGLGISFGTSKNKVDGDPIDGKTNITNVGLSLNGQYFVADNFSIGILGSYFFGKETYTYPGEEDNTYSATILGAGPEIRYYFPVKKTSKLYLKGNTQFGSLTTKDNEESEDDIILSAYGAGMGISLFPVSSVSIDLGLGYQILNLKVTGGFFDELVNTTSSFVIDIGFSIFLQNPTSEEQ